MQRALIVIVLVVSIGAEAFQFRRPRLRGPGGRATKCVQIFYDRGPADGSFVWGRANVTMLQNMLGHFPHVQQIVVPVERYEPGMLGRCEAAIYLGAYYDNAIPADFLKDASTMSTRTAWLGYNVWRMSASEQAAFGIGYRKIAAPDTLKDEHGIPGFFRFHDYKGQVFTKFAEKGTDGSLAAAYDIVVVDAEATAEVVAWARHSTRPWRVPYSVRNGNRFFLADLPFSYMSEADRYFIFADLLFDILNEPERHPGPRPALVRFEDVHPEIPAWQLRSLLDAAEQARIPFAISVIPTFRDPYLHSTPSGGDTDVPMTEDGEFTDFLSEAQGKGASLLIHGVTHQSDERKNPTGVSGLDWEFWDSVTGKPLPYDGAGYVVNRIEQGVTLMEKAGLKPVAWLTPHYQASLLDNVILGQLFLWNVGRVQYAPFVARQTRPLPSLLSFDLSSSQQNGQRLPYFRDLRVHPIGDVQPSGQILPYEIFGDVYGQRLVPETVGYLIPRSPGATTSVTVDDMLGRLRRNRVLRDVWGSLFVHPFVVGTKPWGIGETPGDNRELVRLFREATAMGYRFVDLKSWIRTQGAPLRPTPIESHAAPAGRAFGGSAASSGSGADETPRPQLGVPESISPRCVHPPGRE